jgi:rSAM/selenodomain-associated transferase 2
VKLSVVIPALDEEQQIAGAIESATLESATIGDATDRDVEVLVVDGGSRDRTRERALSKGAQVIDATRGRARQMAVGAVRARGDVVLFLHADTRLPRGWAGAVRDALRDARVVGGAFRLRFDTATLALRIVAWGVRLRVALFELPYGDQALFVRRAALEAMGGVPQAPILEDLDLVRAMRRQGRVAALPLRVTTSSRRYLSAGVWRTVARNAIATLAWRLGWDRERIAAWYRA